MSAKMTPGPWTYFTDLRSEEADPAKRYIRDPKSSRCRHFVGSDGQGFALTVGLSPEVDEANARAIACLPELVEAARYSLRTFELMARRALTTAKLGEDVAEAAVESLTQLRRILARIDGEPDAC